MRPNQDGERMQREGEISPARAPASSTRQTAQTLPLKRSSVVRTCRCCPRAVVEVTESLLLVYGVCKGDSSAGRQGELSREKWRFLD